jgi:hypothetical protein
MIVTVDLMNEMSSAETGRMPPQQSTNGCHSAVETIRAEADHVKTDAIARKLIITSSRPRGIEYHQQRITHITPQQVIIKARLGMSLHPASQITTID